jgi:hemoglobin-like flavoprotein
MSAVIQLPVGRSARGRRAQPRAAAATEVSLTAKQKKLIHESFERIEPARELVAQLFCMKLFRLDPSLRTKFASPMDVQARRFSAAMKLAMITLNHDEGLRPILKLLGARHRQLGIRLRHYRTMARALTWTLETSLEKRFTRETKDAWNAFLNQITRALTV